LEVVEKLVDGMSMTAGKNMTAQMIGSMKGLHMFRSIIMLTGKVKMNFEATTYKTRIEIIQQLLKEAVNQHEKCGVSSASLNMDTWGPLFGIKVEASKTSKKTGVVSQPSGSSSSVSSLPDSVVQRIELKGFKCGALVAEKVNKGAKFVIDKITSEDATISEVTTLGTKGMSAKLPIAILVSNWIVIDEKTKLSFVYDKAWMGRRMSTTMVYNVEITKAAMFLSINKFENDHALLLHAVVLTGQPQNLYSTKAIKANELTLTPTALPSYITLVGNEDPHKPQNAIATGTKLYDSEMYLVKTPGPPKVPVAEWGSFKGVCIFWLVEVTNEIELANMEISYHIDAESDGISFPYLRNTKKIANNTKLLRFVPKVDTQTLRGALETKIGSNKRKL
jgi:hypothetical protein